VRGTPFLFDGFIGGLNTIDSQFTIEDNESRDCLNVTATTRGAIRKRRGTVQFLSGTPPNVEFHSIAAVTISGTRYLIGVAGNSVYSISTTGVFTNITGAAVVTAGVRWSIVQAPVSLAVAGQGRCTCPTAWIRRCSGRAPATWRRGRDATPPATTRPRRTCRTART
jgi:hypothetical protein